MKEPYTFKGKFNLNDYVKKSGMKSRPISGKKSSGLYKLPKLFKRK